jgi:hypothetical protein
LIIVAGKNFNFILGVLVITGAYTKSADKATLVISHDSWWERTI